MYRFSLWAEAQAANQLLKIKARDHLVAVGLVECSTPTVSWSPQVYPTPSQSGLEEAAAKTAATLPSAASWLKAEAREGLMA